MPSRESAVEHDIVLECKNVGHWFGRQKVLHDINLKIVRGEFVSLVGFSGCGKSTLLRAMLGTHPPAGGQILMNGVPVTQPGRDRGIVYQRYSLFPYLTAVQNVAFGLMFDKAPLHFRTFQFWKWWALRKTHLKQAAEALDRFKLSEALHQYPSQMSGGMCQRVAIAQALIMKPQILLLDEPFGALDESSREEQQEMLLDLYEENLKAHKRGEKPPTTIVLVTHELNEAIYVSDRVVALSRKWHWEDTYGPEHPGATIVYDAASPASPRDPVNRYGDFLQQKKEIREVAFEPPFPIKIDNKNHVRFWDEVREGKAAGVMAR
jgi:NitT/TauT family transport system ATP-binding protein